MFKSKRLIIILCISVTAWSCVDNKSVDERETVTVTIAPLKYIIDEIVGNDLVVNIIVPEGANPETYEPTPQQIIELSNSRCIFSTGLIDFEHQLSERLSENSASSIINLSEGIEVIEGSCSHSNSDHHKHSHSKGVDPHIWTSPRLVKQMAGFAYKKIALLYPESSGRYNDNYASLLERLDSLDRVIMQKISTSKHKYFVIYHPALTYFANDYNIEQISLEQDGKEPSVSHLKNIIEVARKDSVKYVFFQSQFSRSTVESLAYEIGAEAIEINPLSENIVENLDHITDLIIK